MDSKGTIGIVTVTYNSAKVIEEFLDSILSQSYRDIRLFLVDNASTDNTLSLVALRDDSRITVIANRTNLGVAEGNNQGIRACLGSGYNFVLLINNDTVFDANLIEQLLSGLDMYAVEMCCPKMMYFDEPNRIWAAGGNFRPWLGCRATHIGFNQIDNGQFDVARRVDYVPTCCVLVLASLFFKIGLMDERYFVYADDADFMYRAMKAGAKLMFLPTARILHKVGRLTGGETSPFSIRYGTRNRLFFMLKHFGLLRTLPWLLVCQLSYIAGLVSGKGTLSWFKLKEAAFAESLAMYREVVRTA